MDWYRPTRPTPEGPSSSAIAFDRMTFTAMLMTDDPPISAVDFRIWL